MKSVPLIICLLGAFLHKGFGVKVQYDGDEVLKIIPQTAQQAQYLQEITNQWQLDLWMPVTPEAIHAGREVHMRIPSSYVQQIKDSLLQYNIPYNVLIDNVQKLVDLYTINNINTRAVSLESYNYTRYHPMDEIYEWMEQINEKHSDVVTKIFLGQTYERRSIYYFRIGYPSDKRKKIMFIDCGFHAREWISVAFCQWFVKEERLWRKNRAPYNNGTCYGVDLNRNFDAKWCTVGASMNCTSNIFCGSSAVSEPETKALSGLIEAIKQDVIFYLTIHSYGKMILLPYGYTYEPSKDHEIMMEVANKANAKMKEKHNNEYQVGSSSIVIVAIMQWTREERSFCVEAYFSNAHSIIAVQRAFRLQFAVPPRGRVPGRQSIVNWVNAFRTAGNVSCVRRGPERRITTPQNIERVRAAVLQSPKRSAQKQSFALGISRRSLHRILHDELNFHPYKMCVVQHLSAWDYLTRRTSCEDMLATIPRDAIVFFSDEAHFHLSG
ncbi:carboxypeptidase B2-like isoform X2 [Ranitomeya imitator]|uniref:carboxypeptidase B2-like isoform X2 n=1 Tax=Ranitomeya imitator TaxID=111125 RepID=UPI0037E73F37